ncbi:MAG: hypothetical protein IJY02_02640, partial [Oscillospiraceae bacterium]|nr:hypothetical protein [Oscillospiraceae bacterium]
LTNEALSNIAETTMNNVNSFFESGSCENELCYHCGQVENCRKLRRKKCFGLSEKQKRLR